MHEAGKHREEAETRMNEAIEDCILADELCVDAKEREQEAMTDLLTFQRQRRES